MQKDMQGVLFPVKAEDTSDYDLHGLVLHRGW